MEGTVNWAKQERRDQIMWSPMPIQKNLPLWQESEIYFYLLYAMNGFLSLEIGSNPNNTSMNLQFDFLKPGGELQSTEHDNIHTIRSLVWREVVGMIGRSASGMLSCGKWQLWESIILMSPSDSHLPESTYFLQFPARKGAYLSTPFASGLALWLTWTNRMWQK